MTFREKIAAVSLVAIVVVYGGYFLNVARLSWDTPPPAIDGALIRAVISLVVLLIIFRAVVAFFHDGKAEEEDERDRMYELIGERNGATVLGLGVIGAIVMLLLQLPPFQVIHVLLAAGVLSEVVKIVTQLVLYRRGV